jgi:hypothetical protein
LSAFWFVYQHFGLFASTLVCLPALWLNELPTNKPKCQQTTQFDKTKQKFRSLEVRAEPTPTYKDLSHFKIAQPFIFSYFLMHRFIYSRNGSRTTE